MHAGSEPPAAPAPAAPVEEEGPPKAALPEGFFDDPEVSDPEDVQQAQDWSSESCSCPVSGRCQGP
jgi:hypothetical protein